MICFYITLTHENKLKNPCGKNLSANTIAEYYLIKTLKPPLFPTVTGVTKTHRVGWGFSRTPVKKGTII